MERFRGHQFGNGQVIERRSGSFFIHLQVLFQLFPSVRLSVDDTRCLRIAHNIRFNNTMHSVVILLVLLPFPIILSSFLVALIFARSLSRPFELRQEVKKKWK